MTDADLSQAVIPLMKGVVYRDTHERAWQHLTQLQPQVRDYVEVLGLQVVIDEAEGYAYLRQRPADDDADQVPRLIARRSLSFHVSLLLALLRKKLVEFDATSGEARLILTRDDIVDMMRLFLADTANQVRLAERIDAHINRVVEMGFLRRLRGTDNRFEVRRILKAFVDAQWLGELEQRLATYRTHAAEGHPEGAAHEPG